MGLHLLETEYDLRPKYDKNAPESGSWFPGQMTFASVLTFAVVAVLFLLI